jgi:von Willebrand factor type A domain
MNSPGGPGRAGSGWWARAGGVVVLGAALLGAGCTSGGVATPPAKVTWAGPGHDIDLPEPHDSPGTAVAVLIDTSGSMRDAVKDAAGKPRTKSQLAHEALEKILQRSAAWTKEHPDKRLEVSLHPFSGGVHDALALGKLDDDRVKAGLGKVPQPDGGTAIGQALIVGFRSVWGSGCQRKFVLCITDGENTVPPDPAAVLRQLHQQTGGKVEVHFIAFDVKASTFAFLKDYNGRVVEASDAKQLEEELTKIYEKRILIESDELLP